MPKTTARLIFDNPDHYGRIAQFGYGRDWTFPASRQQRPSEEGSWQPEWAHTDTEIVQGLDLLGLRGTAIPVDQDLDDWAITAGRWVLEKPDSSPSVYWLSYRVSEPNEQGIIVGALEYAPNFCVHLIDFVPPPDQTEAVYTAIEFRSIAEVNYRLTLPTHDADQKYPSLYRSEGPVDDDVTWELVDVCERVDVGNQAAVAQPIRRAVAVESVDASLVIRFAGLAEPWIYTPKLEEHQLLVPGFLAIEFHGHAGEANPVQITYPLTGHATPYEGHSAPTYCNQTPAYKWARSRYEYGPEGTVTVTQHSTGAPYVTLTRGPNVHSRPLVSVVHEYRDAVLSDARSTSINTYTRWLALTAQGKDPAELQSLWYRRTLGRGWEFGAGLRDPNNYYGDVLLPNMECDVRSGWDGSSENQIGVFYLSSPEVARRAAVEQGITAQYAIHGRDFLSARMHGRKTMLWPCSPVTDSPGLEDTDGLWYLDEWVQWWLTRCAFGYTLTCPSGIVVRRPRLKEVGWEFDHRTPVHEGIDRVLMAHGLTELRTRTDGGLETTETPTYSTPDFTLDESTATGDDQIEEIEANVEDEDFRNFIAVAHAGGIAVAYDEDSIQTPGDADFIGDAWMDVLNADDATDPEVQASKRLIERMKRRRIVRWTRLLKTDLPPGSWVLVQVDNIGVPTDTVMRVMQDTGRQTAGDPKPQSTFLCELLGADES